MQFSSIQKSKSDNQKCLRVGHWNLNGIISKQFGNKLEMQEVYDKVKKFDLFGVSETHLLPKNGKQLDLFQNFHSYRKHGKRRNYGSGGISIYIKNNIVNGTSVIHGESSDCMWVCLKKSFFQLEEDIYICFIYIPPVNSTFTNSQENNSFELLENDVCKFKSKGRVVLMGDFNSRTSASPDFNVIDDDKYTPVPEQYNSDEHESLYNRENEDICSVNEYGKKLLELCIETELRILNGRMLGDLEGKLTCHKWNGSSTVDYGIVQNSLFREIDFFKVYDLMGHLSDHCLISLGLKCNFKATVSCKSNIYKLEKNFKWDTLSELIYKSTLVSSSVDKKIKDILNSGSDMTVEDMTNNVNDILLNSAKQALIVSIPDLCNLTYFATKETHEKVNQKDKEMV